MPFSWWHAHALKLADFDRQTMEAAGQNPADYISRMASSGPFYGVLTPDNQVVTVAGIMAIYGHKTTVGEAWVAPGVLVEQYPKAFHAAIKGMIHLLREHMQLNRVQCRVQVGHPSSHAWVAGPKGDGQGPCLGFRKEAYLEAAGPNGEDYIQYVMIRGKDY